MELVVEMHPGIDFLPSHKAFGSDNLNFEPQNRAR